LHNKYTGRCFVYYVFSQAKIDGHLFGRIERSTVNFILKNKHKELEFDTFYLCGPNEMIAQVSDILKENNIPEKQIKFELFTTTTSEKEVETAAGQTKIKVLIDDEETTYTVPNGTVILDAVITNVLYAPDTSVCGIW